MKPWLKVKLEEVLTPGITYRQIGLKFWGEGACEHEPMDGSQTKCAELFRAEVGDIIVNKIWARNSGVAVVPENLAGCFGFGEFPMFSPKEDRLESRWTHWLRSRNLRRTERAPPRYSRPHLQRPTLVL